MENEKEKRRERRGKIKVANSDFCLYYRGFLKIGKDNKMRNIKLTIEYDGKDFNGWQKQPDKLNIQGNIEKAIETVTGEKVDLMASGRTDRGVHALGQVANFKTNSQIPIEKFAIAINSRLKKSIVIKKAEEVDERFHSRLNCKRKTYRYIINNSPYGTAIYRYLETHIPHQLNINHLEEVFFLHFLFFLLLLFLQFFLVLFFLILLLQVFQQ